MCRLCKIAQCTTGGVSGTVSMAQLVLRDGLPMYSIDPRTLQVCMLCISVQPYYITCSAMLLFVSNVVIDYVFACLLIEGNGYYVLHSGVSSTV